jgi:vitamin B12 transporter
MKIRFGAVLFVLWPLLSVYSQNPQDSIPLTQLEEVVVSDSRFPLKTSQSGKVVTKLTEQDLANLSGLTLAEILNRQTGLELSGSRSRPGSVLGVFARGGRGRQVLILIDGIRYSDPSSYSREFDLRLLPVASIASIEILKGASSTLYGSNAATVVIRITTKKGTAGSSEIQLGSFLGTLNSSDSKKFNIGKTANHAIATGELEHWNYTASLSQEYASGLSDWDSETRETDPNSLWFADLKLSRTWHGGTELGAFFSRSGLRTAYDNAFTGSDANFEFTGKQLRTGFDVKINRKWGSLQWHAAYADYNSKDFSDYPYQYSGNTFTSDLVYRRNLNNHTYLLSGLTYIKDSFDATRFEILDPYINSVIFSDSGWNLNSGVRLNIHSVYGSTSVFSLNPSRVWKFQAGYIKVLASWSSAYITPSLPQLYGTFGANPNLKPERNSGGEFGLELRLHKSNFTSSAVVFNRHESGTVIFDGANSQFINAASEIEASGIELETKVKLLQSVDLRAFYTFTNRTGDDALRIPRHKAGFALNAGLGKNIRFLVDYQYTGLRPDLDFQSYTPVTLPAFSILDLRFIYAQNSGKFKVYLFGSNLFNTKYQEVFGYSTPGRNFGLGWNLKLN